MRHIIEINGKWQGGSFAPTEVAAEIAKVKSQHPGKDVTSRVRGEAKPAANQAYQASPSRK